MARLFGRTWAKEELLAHVGDVSVLGGIRMAELADGPGRGVRVADVHNGGGLRFTVLIDRGMDIGQASFNGVPLALQTSAGVRSPYFFDADGYEAARNIHGGLLFLCGLSAAGHPSEDGFGKHGLHGRASNTPAEFLSLGDEWDGDDYAFWIRGRVRESWLFGFNLQMTRQITLRLGENRFFVDDVFENLGSAPAPLMLLYHCNFGFPLVAEGSELVVDDVDVRPRDALAEKGLATHRLSEAPQAGYAEQVFYHDARADREGNVSVVIVNRWLNDGRGLAAYIRYRQAELPRLIQWKQMGVVDYTVGVEPANCLPEGRAREGERGSLKIIAPGEVVRTRLEFGVFDSVDAVQEHVGG